METDHPPLIYLGPHDPLPEPETAWDQSSGVPGLLAAGGGLSVDRLREAYSKGCFPWFSLGAARALVESRSAHGFADT